ncbi:MAG: HdeD family acid-resistance protein [Nocardioides sp.]|uniref:HdeD family acid-resistance protein n=1 Tax=Nocardioides sp. TaxID=35761 RepID=UPI0039E4BF61
METDSLTPSWQMIVLRGFVAIIFGILAIAWPLSTALALVILWGIYALVDGASSLVQVFTREHSGLARIGLALMGVIALAAGLIAIFHPLKAGLILAWFLGIWLIARGIIELAMAIGGGTAAPRGLLVLGALLDFLLGYLFISHPGHSALGITVFIGIVALVWGVVFIALGFTLRKATKEFAAA